MGSAGLSQLELSAKRNGPTAVVAGASQHPLWLERHCTALIMDR
jgi:hypothetical protein